MAKKLYPGGFRLTLAKARALAVQEFGTAKGLKQSDWANSEGFYVMTLGNLEIEIHPDMSCSDGRHKRAGRANHHQEDDAHTNREV